MEKLFFTYIASVLIDNLHKCLIKKTVLYQYFSYFLFKIKIQTNSKPCFILSKARIG